MRSSWLPAGISPARPPSGLLDQAVRRGHVRLADVPWYHVNLGCRPEYAQYLELACPCCADPPVVPASVAVLHLVRQASWGVYPHWYLVGACAGCMSAFWASLPRFRVA